MDNVNWEALLIIGGTIASLLWGWAKKQQLYQIKVAGWKRMAIECVVYAVAATFNSFVREWKREHPGEKMSKSGADIEARTRAMKIAFEYAKENYDPAVVKQLTSEFMDHYIEQAIMRAKAAAKKGTK